MKNYLPTRTTSLFLVTLFTSSLMLAGCGGAPRNNPLVDESRAAYDAAALDPEVVSKAPDVLQEAEADLRRSEQLLSDGADPEEVEHYAYLAKQRVAIAQETAQLKRAEASIEQAEVERKEVQLQARTAEAERARAEADVSRLEAERRTTEAEASRDLAEEKSSEAQLAREQAEQALAQNKELANRIAELEAEQTARGLVLTLSDVLFDVGKADLKLGAQRAIDQLSNFLNEYSERTVLIEGFTDNTGSDEYNQDLSSHRSASVKSALIARGISDMRIQTLGYGESFPKATNGTVAGRQQNRRVEVIISDNSGDIPTRTN
jgi:outer membrane protein OmpA-like peptidoglycan-associated protein